MQQPGQSTLPGSNVLQRYTAIWPFNVQSSCYFINVGIAFVWFCSYTPLSGFYGVLSGFLVGIKQIIPDQELNICVLKIKAKVFVHIYYQRENASKLFSVIILKGFLTPEFFFLLSGFLLLLHLSRFLSASSWRNQCLTFQSYCLESTLVGFTCVTSKRGWKQA